MLHFRQIAASYGAHEPPVLSEVSVGFAPGSFTALVGPNGCGKSTLLKAAMGLLPRQSGRVTLDDTELTTLTRRDRARHIAYLPQECHCPDYISVAELVELGGYARRGLFGGVTRARKQDYLTALETVGLADMAAAQVSALSGGQRQRAWIAMILAQAAQVILLDEPVNHLDLRYQIAVLELVRRIAVEQGRIVVCVLHDLNLAASYADRIVMMHRGRFVAQGPVREVLTPDNLRMVYGVEADIFDRGVRQICMPLGLAE